MNNHNEVLKKVLIEISPSEKELKFIRDYVKTFSDSLRKNASLLKLDVDIFVGGSFAKNTMIKKEKYDVDLFVRFSEEYRGKDLSKLTEKILNKTKNLFKNFSKIHGSRDYFKIDVTPSFFLEIIPVLKVKFPKNADNITDLSYFHVDYIRKKMKEKNLLEQVRLAKSFCHAKKCYGAESYINGFSGYALELLIYHYKSFLKFIRAVSTIKGKQIIDIEKGYKNKTEIIMNMNSAKMTSPIILIDPTFKERNVLAALSEETFRIFQKECLNFLKSPSIKDFKKEEVDLTKIKNIALKEGKSFIFLEFETDKQEGDIAGTKLLKFFKHLRREIEKYYIIDKSGFEYLGNKKGQVFFVLINKKEIIFNGPYKEDKENLKRFLKKHKNTFIKNGKIYAREKFQVNAEDFINEWKSINYQKIIEMGIISLKVLDSY